MQVHDKKSVLANLFNKSNHSSSSNRTLFFNNLVTAYNDSEVGAVIEIVELPYTYQMSNLRKVLVARGLSPYDFTLRRLKKDENSLEIPKEERPILIRKNTDNKAVVVKGS